MIIQFLPLFLIFLSDITVSQRSQEVLTHFEKFQSQHKRYYRNPEERKKRLGHFARNHKRIKELNEEAKLAGRNVTFGLNKFADKTEEERRRRYSKIHPHNHTDIPLYKPRRARHHNKKTSKRPKRQNMEIPDYFDLRDVMVNGSPIVGPVKDQEQCGCCWAFATTAITETANAVASKAYRSLSDQEICDCADSGDTPGCVGGDPRNGLKFVHRNGQASDSSYPYEEFRANTTGNCVADEKRQVIESETMQVYQFDPEYAEEDIMENLYYNHIPSAAYFRVGEKFEWYNSGVLQTEDCYQMTPAEWHSVAIVGYGTSENNVPYWIVRNSWADNWGEGGYVRIKRGIDYCLIESHPATAMIGGNSDDEDN
ncbi:hypothetical protein CRE_21120 [Caenorhabditis remanei]|uniref:Uncharacterized protein n=1 Tax=Caenorhabditis remanei TaxID=31234 RepID=E3MEU0_CAERE|nr:hypothetical protein CRE_21120 [Caenorhabditis remanei]